VLRESLYESQNESVFSTRERGTWKKKAMTRRVAGDQPNPAAGSPHTTNPISLFWVMGTSDVFDGAIRSLMRKHGVLGTVFAIEDMPNKLAIKSKKSWLTSTNEKSHYHMKQL
jgi:hypothetical protein